jgi:hypothetical protein
MAPQTDETPAVGAVPGSEMHIAASSGDTSENVLPLRTGQEPPGDPLQILRTHWGDDVPTSFRPIGEVAVGIVGDLVFRRCVEDLCHHPRLVAELLAEIAAERSIRLEVETKLARYCGLATEALATTGGDRLPPLPLHAVVP